MMFSGQPFAAGRGSSVASWVVVGSVGLGALPLSVPKAQGRKGARLRGSIALLHTRERLIHPPAHRLSPGKQRRPKPCIQAMTAGCLEQSSLVSCG
jgi:hypothetical protein